MKLKEPQIGKTTARRSCLNPGACSIGATIAGRVANTNPANYTVERDQYNFVKLDEPITTDRLKIEVKLHDELSVGILSYKINGVIPSDVETVFADPDLELKRIKGKAQVTLALDVR